MTSIGSSGLERLLNSNVSPTEPQANEIKRLIEQLDNNTGPKQTRSQVAANQKLASSYRSIISASRRLPADILLLIFYQCSTVYTTEEQDTKRKEFPWVIGAACAFWRSLVIGTPTLWNRPQCFFSSTETEQTLQRELQLARSASLPLHLSIKCGLYAGIIPPISEFIIANIHRIKTLELDRVPFAFLTQAIRLPAGSCTILEHVLLVIPSRDESDDLLDQIDDFDEILDDSEITIFQESPRLVRATIHINIASDDWFDPMLIRFPWPNMTFLDLSGVPNNITPLLQLLTTCTQLQELRTKFTTNDSEDDFVADRILVHNNLRRLSTAGNEGMVFRQFFQSVKLPNLTHLEGGWHSEQEYAPVVLCLRHSAFRLTHFTLSLYIPTDIRDHSKKRLYEFMQEMPTLIHLSLCRVSLPDDFFSALTARDGLSFLPCLAYLDMACLARGFAFTATEVVEMVISRRLKRFHLRVPGLNKTKDMVYERLKELRKDGLDLLVSSRFEK